MMCGACGRRRAGTPLYGTAAAVCNPCRRLAASWCWTKEQGFDQIDVHPRHQPDRPGAAYLCTLCGYWHWTLNLDAPPAEQRAAVWALTTYFQDAGFHINTARGWSRLRSRQT